MADPTLRDSVDVLLASWAERRADLDFSPVGIVARLGRVRGHIDAALDGVFAAHGLTAANFGVLVTLARIDDGRGVSQRRLMAELGLTSGTISVRMDRLVDAGLVDRRVDPDSRRTTLITLTARGRELFERVVPAHLANEDRLLAALDPAERDALAALLRKLLLEFEGSCPEVAPLGATVAPAHAAMALRESVGLTPLPALLVRSVDERGPAARAGLRTGDLLLSAGGHALRSVTALHQAIAETRGRLQLETQRGGDACRVTVELAGDRAGSPRPVPGEHAV